MPAGAGIPFVCCFSQPALPKDDPCRKATVCFDADSRNSPFIYLMHGINGVMIVYTNTQGGK
jgi:hypothetical protein